MLLTEDDGGGYDDGSLLGGVAEEQGRMVA